MDCKLVLDEESLTTHITKVLEIGISPQYIGHEEKAIKRILLKKKNTYYNQLHGIMLRFDDLEFLDKTGRIIDDNPLIYWKISAKFTIFTVSPGQIVKTKVTAIGANYIRSTLVQCISVSLDLDSELPAEDKSLCKTLKPGDDIIFRVQTFTLAEMCLTGLIDKTCIEQMRLLYDL